MAVTYSRGVDVRRAHNVLESGVSDARVLLFAHGFGCDHNMWRYVAPHFEARHRVVLFDYVGSGGAERPYDAERYATLEGYADDVVRICDELDLRDVVFVGHSVSAMIGVLAQLRAPERISALAMVAPSPRYIDDVDYTGGFTRTDIDDMLASLSSNYLGWSSAMAPVVMGNAERPELGEELTRELLSSGPGHRPSASRERRSCPTTGRTFRSSRCPRWCCSAATTSSRPMVVGEYVAAAVPDSSLVVLEASGHCPNLSAPDEVVKALETFLAEAR